MIRTLTLILLVAFNGVSKQVNAQDLDHHFVLITISNDEYNNNGKPLTLIISNIFQAPLTETPYGTKVDESVKRQIRYQFLHYLNAYHKDGLLSFQGGFRESTVWIRTDASKQKLLDIIEYNYNNSAFEKHNRIVTRNFEFKKIESPDNKMMMETLRSFLFDGNPLD